ncbi:MAG: GntR family transcriptional regulator [Pararhodobacter sp.]|nr:GntR family transcriptional regulator [Pararhodobacter sp.]
MSPSRYDPGPNEAQDTDLSAPLPESIPRWRAVEARIAEAITRGDWKAGMVLPGETALSASMGVAVGTLRRALAELTAAGVLSRRRKTGTVVTGRAPRHSLRFLFDYYRLHDLDGRLCRAETRTIGIARAVATPAEKDALDMAEGSEVLRLQRLRIVEGRAVMHDHFTLPARLLPGFPDTPEAAPDLLYRHMSDAAGIRIAAIREHLAAAAAAPDIAEALGIAAGAPVLLIEETAFDEANSPVAHALHHAETSAHRYVNEIR